MIKNGIKALILCAGKGQRISSESLQLPKVLRQVAGKSLIEHVLLAMPFIKEEDTTLVVGYLKEQVIETLGNTYQYVVQEQQLGTGHAVASTKKVFEGYAGDVLICYGDMPLLTQKTLTGIIEHHQMTKADCTLLTGVPPRPLPYGRIIRNAEGEILRIVEEKDCSPEERAISELNMGVYVVKSPLLFDALKQLKNNNASSEYYLTDLAEIFHQNGHHVTGYTLVNTLESIGVNTFDDLIRCETLLTANPLI